MPFSHVPAKVRPQDHYDDLPRERHEIVLVRVMPPVAGILLLLPGCLMAIITYDRRKIQPEPSALGSESSIGVEDRCSRRERQKPLILLWSSFHRWARACGRHGALFLLLSLPPKQLHRLAHSSFFIICCPTRSKNDALRLGPSSGIKATPIAVE